jgi:5-hydroxyisourate hydrolase
VTGISSHVLDATTGRPASGLTVTLERCATPDGHGGWTRLAAASTDHDGRVTGLLPGDRATPGTYRLLFDTGTHYARTGTETFYPLVAVVFRIADPARHHHVPLLLSPYAYSTYRGS